MFVQVKASFYKKSKVRFTCRRRCVTLKWKVNFTMLKKGVNYLKNKLEELRKENGINQEELADALEVSRQTIGSLENGRYNPSIILAFKIAHYFGKSIEEIFIYEEGKVK